jgi:hypothetical protein
VSKSKGKEKTPATPELKDEPKPTGGPPALDLALSQVRPYTGRILAGAGIIALGALAFAGWRWYTASEAGKASLAFAAVLEKAEAPIVPAASPQPSDALTFPDARGRAEAALAQMKALEAAHGSSKVTASAYLMQGAFLYDLARWDEAVTAYDRVLASRPPSGIAYLAREGKGYVREAEALSTADAAAKKAAFDKALAAFKEIQTDPQGAFFDVACYHQGRILALQGETAEAIKMYKLALEKKPAFQLEEQLKSRLAVLEQKAGMPTPVPAPKQ